MSRLLKNKKIYLTLLSLVFTLIIGCSHPSPKPSALPLTGSNLAMGNPSGATASTDLAQHGNYLLDKTYYALSYDCDRRRPNWVSWRLTADDIGDAPRTDFYPDEALPQIFARVSPSDYTGSGFDRGHMCPHGDRSANDEMSRATFAMTNVIPQSPNLNQHAWANLEEYCRNLTRAGKVLYIITGPWGQGGEGREGPASTIGRDHIIIVPERCWKVIMVLDAGPGDDVARVNGQTRLIAVIMPNDMSVGEEWDLYRVSVAEVEHLTGYTFFDRVPSSVITPLKQKVDMQVIFSSGGSGD